MPWRLSNINVPTGKDGQPDFSQLTHVVNQLLRETNGRIDDLSKTSQRRVNGTSQLTFGTVGAGASVERIMHVPAAHENLVAHVNPIGDPGSGLVWSSRITAANQVSVRVVNPTGAPVAVNTIFWKAVVS